MIHIVISMYYNVRVIVILYFLMCIHSVLKTLVNDKECIELLYCCSVVSRLLVQIVVTSASGFILYNGSF